MNHQTPGGLDVVVVRMYGDLLDPNQPLPPDEATERDTAIRDAVLTVSPLTECAIVIRVDDDNALDVVASGMNHPDELAGFLAMLAAGIATGDAVEVSVPNFPPTEEPRP